MSQNAIPDCVITTAQFTISLSKDDMKEFKTLIRRGIDKWPDASANTKALADMLTHGCVMQDYWSQAGVAVPDPIPPIFGDRNHA